MSPKREEKGAEEAWQVGRGVQKIRPGIIKTISFAEI
jgi:hypothetical protein